MPSLIFYRSDQEMLRMPLGSAVLKVGRHPANDLTLPDEDISRNHAYFEIRDSVHWVVDQSRNGTWLNGKRMREAPLKDGDELKLGSWKVIFDDKAWGEKETVVRKEARPDKAAVSFSGIIGSSEPMKKVFGMIEKVAPTDNTVLIVGETGTGKELVARAVHARSQRERGPFVAINCGAISPQLIESELFGHERGAFTGAVDRHAGAFEQARGGTLFLDEVGELPMDLQPKLLRVLEEKKFRRVGGTGEVTTDARIVAATHRDLQVQVKEGKFRSDLFFRLFTVPVALPPLRERGGDIVKLTEHFLESLQGNGAAKKTLTSEALSRIASHPWKGNVRELKNVMTRTLLFASTDRIGPNEVLFLQSEDEAEEGRTSLENAERDVILKALRECSGNKTKAAKTLGIAKSTLFHKLKEYSIPGD